MLIGALIDKLQVITCSFFVAFFLIWEKSYLVNILYFNYHYRVG